MLLLIVTVLLFHLSAIRGAYQIRKGGGDYISYRFSATSAGTQYDSCRVSYTDPATGKVIEGVAKSGDYDEEAKNHKRLEITARVKSAGEAQALAENHLRLHNKFAKTARFSLPGDSGMVEAADPGPRRARVRFSEQHSGWLYVLQHPGAKVTVEAADGHTHKAALGEWMPKVNERRLAHPRQKGGGTFPGVLHEGRWRVWDKNCCVLQCVWY